MEELQENFKKLTLESPRVMEPNAEVEATYTAECEAAPAEELRDLQKADREDGQECEQKSLDEKVAKNLRRSTYSSSD